MSQRKSRRKRWKWLGRARRQRAYKHNVELHAYEESVVMRVIEERGYCRVIEWVNGEPERWRKRQLHATLRRLERQGRLKAHNYRWGRRHHTNYTVNREGKAA
jgi:hypothetical protein